MSIMLNKKVNKTNELPILYSLRNCPFAMRARIAIFKAKKPIQLRDVILSNKPQEMMIASPKGTVPVLVINHEDHIEKTEVIDESLDIMIWALQTSDPNNLLHQENPRDLKDMFKVITTFDNEFKLCLEAYKCAKRYKEDNIVECRQACEVYIKVLEELLSQYDYIFSNKESLVDIALLPFIRQFARIERQWYLQSPYPKLRQWLNNYLQSPMFTKVMTKYPLWMENHQIVLFGDI